MKIVSYNILASSYTNREWYPHVPREHLLWEERRDRLAAYLHSLDADVLCLQEVEHQVYPWLSDHLPEYTGHFVKKRRGKADGCATFYRLPLVREEALYYSDEHKGRPSGHVAQILHFEEFSLANTHLKWDAPETPPDDQVGLQQVEELLAFIADHPGAWVLLGDLNARSDTLVMERVRRAGFTLSITGATCNINQTPQEIDYICWNKQLIGRAESLPPIAATTPLPSLDYPSDHLAVTAQLEAIDYSS